MSLSNLTLAAAASPAEGLAHAFNPDWPMSLEPGGPRASSPSILDKAPLVKKYGQELQAAVDDLLQARREGDPSAGQVDRREEECCMQEIATPKGPFEPKKKKEKEKAAARQPAEKPVPKEPAGISKAIKLEKEFIRNLMKVVDTWFVLEGHHQEDNIDAVLEVLDELEKAKKKVHYAREVNPRDCGSIEREMRSPKRENRRLAMAFPFQIERGPGMELPEQHKMDRLEGHLSRDGVKSAVLCFDRPEDMENFVRDGARADSKGCEQDRPVVVGSMGFSHGVAELHENGSIRLDEEHVTSGLDAQKNGFGGLTRAVNAGRKVAAILPASAMNGHAETLSPGNEPNHFTIATDGIRRLLELGFETINFGYQHPDGLGFVPVRTLAVRGEAVSMGNAFAAKHPKQVTLKCERAPECKAPSPIPPLHDEP